MNDSFYKHLIMNSVNGYAYHKIILDKSGAASDYELIEYNDSFLQLTGLRPDSGRIQRITDLIPEFSAEDRSWIDLYGDVALNAKEMRFEKYSEPLHQWFNVYVFSPEKCYFVTSFSVCNYHNILYFI